VGPEFSPYVTGGHWELTSDDEWIWVSDYPFGWITFHYGRWVWASGASWAWVPGYRYAPAWVDFRIGASGYIGWGPLPPRYVWNDGVYLSIGVRRPLPFIFCPTRYVFSHSVHRHVIRDRYRVRSIAAETWRYRPHRTGSVSRYVRGPRPVEARIPARALPERRTIARPRIAEPFDRRGQDGRSLRQQSFSRSDSSRGVDQRSLSSARRADRRERAPDTSSARRATPSRSRDARPRQWFDDSSGGRQRAAPRRPEQPRFDQRARGSMDLGRPNVRSTPQPGRWREPELPKERTERKAERSSSRERSYTPSKRSKGRSSSSTGTPRKQHRGERENRGTRR
jgi:hypothetical protein